MSRSLSAALVCVVLVGTALGPGLAVATDTPHRSPDGGDSGAAVAGSPTPPFEILTQGEFAQSTFEIEVFENGSARWTFQFVRPLRNESERDQFRTFADRFESEETDFYRTYRERSVELTDTASNRTGREMTARNFSRSARIAPSGNRGVVEISFIWTDLAVVEGDRVRVADIFEGGFYIADGQLLEFEAGPGLAFDPSRTEPQPDEFSGDSIATSDTITWIGEQQFTDKHPRVVLGPDGETGTAEPTDASGTAGGPTTSAGSDGTDDGSGTDPMLLVGLLLVIVVGLGAGAAWRAGALGSTTPDTGSSGAGETVDPDGTADNASADSADGTTAATEPAVPDEELLTDEDRVIRMLEDNGGRMKQANIVDETGWSKSKVSMLLSDMEEEGDISKLRVGRENIVSLKGHEPDAAGSPFDDDN